jgi:cell division protein FtsL
MAPKLRKAKADSIVAARIKAIIFSSRGFPLILTFTMLGILFVLFRMKGIEMEYKISDINRSIENTSLENKELKAQKARLLSVTQLTQLAKKYDLKQPGQGQIIVIP